jgi:hypothetical protein
MNGSDKESTFRVVVPVALVLVAVAVAVFCRIGLLGASLVGMSLASHPNPANQS